MKPTSIVSMNDVNISKFKLGVTVHFTLRTLWSYKVRIKVRVR